MVPGPSRHREESQAAFHSNRVTQPIRVQKSLPLGRVSLPEPSLYIICVLIHSKQNETLIARRQKLCAVGAYVRVRLCMLMLKDGNVSCTQPESGDICLAVVYSYVALNRYLPVIVFMFVKVFNTGRETIRELYNYDLTIGLKASTSCFVNCFELCREKSVGSFASYFTIMTIATRPSFSSPHKEQIRLTHFLVIFLPGHTNLYLDI